MSNIIRVGTDVVRRQPEHAQHGVPRHDSLFEKHTIELPLESPEHLTWRDCIAEPAVEVLTAEKMRQEEDLKPGPLPESVFHSVEPTRPSLVRHVEIRTDVLLGFLEALAQIVPADKDSLLSAVKISHRYIDNGSRLYLEAHNTAITAVISIAANGGDQEFSALAPLHRAINVLRYLRPVGENIAVGMDEEQIHFGPLSFPYAGLIEHFPAREAMFVPDARAVLPAHYVSEIATRLFPALTSSIDMNSTTAGMILIDFSDQVAVVADGARAHVIKLPRMGVESRIPRGVPPAVIVPPEFIQFLAATVNREWVAIQVGYSQIAASGEDFVVVSRATPGAGFPEWRGYAKLHAGAWVVDRELALKAATSSAELSGSGAVKIAVDAMTDKMTISCVTHSGEVFRSVITAKRYGGAAPAGMVSVRAVHLVDAVQSCGAGLLRFGIGSKDEPITVQSEKNDEFLAALLPIR